MLIQKCLPICLQNYCEINIWAYFPTIIYGKTSISPNHSRFGHILGWCSGLNTVMQTSKPEFEPQRHGLVHKYLLEIFTPG